MNSDLSSLLTGLTWGNMVFDSCFYTQSPLGLDACISYYYSTHPVNYAFTALRKAFGYQKVQTVLAERAVFALSLAPILLEKKGEERDIVQRIFCWIRNYTPIVSGIVCVVVVVAKAVFERSVWAMGALAVLALRWNFQKLKAGVYLQVLVSVFNISVYSLSIVAGNGYTFFALERIVHNVHMLYLTYSCLYRKPEPPDFSVDKGRLACCQKEISYVQIAGKAFELNDEYFSFEKFLSVLPQQLEDLDQNAFEDFSVEGLQPEKDLQARIPDHLKCFNVEVTQSEEEKRENEKFSQAGVQVLSDLLKEESDYPERLVQYVAHAVKEREKYQLSGQILITMGKSEGKDNPYKTAALVLCALDCLAKEEGVEQLIYMQLARSRLEILKDLIWVSDHQSNLQKKFELLVEKCKRSVVEKCKRSDLFSALGDLQDIMILIFLGFAVFSRWKELGFWRQYSNLGLKHQLFPFRISIYDGLALSYNYFIVKRLKKRFADASREVVCEWVKDEENRQKAVAFIRELRVNGRVLDSECWCTNSALAHRVLLKLGVLK